MREEPTQEGRELTPFEKMAQLAAKVVSVPKEEVDKRQKDWQENRRWRAKESNPKAG